MLTDYSPVRAFDKIGGNEEDLFSYCCASNTISPLSMLERVWQFWMGTYFPYKESKKNNHSFRLGAMDVVFAFMPLLITGLTICVVMAIFLPIKKIFPCPELIEPGFLFVVEIIGIARALLAAVLTLLSLPVAGIAYLAIKEKMASPFSVFQDKKDFQQGRGLYGVVNFFDFFVGRHQQATMSRQQQYHCGALDILVLPFLMDFIYNKLKFNGGTGWEKLAKILLTPLFVLNLATRYSVGAMLTLTMMIVKVTALLALALITSPYLVTVKSHRFFVDTADRHTGEAKETNCERFLCNTLNPMSVL